jgi:ribosomal protein S18 acetylase RimI-like enzyme
MDSPNAFGSTLQDAAARSEADWHEQLEALATFVAVVDGQDVGTVRGAPDSTEPATALLISMWVAPRYRGRGVGERLVQSVVAWARSSGFSRLVLDVADDNEPALKLYSRVGLNQRAKRDHYLLHAPIF